MAASCEIASAQQIVAVAANAGQSRRASRDRRAFIGNSEFHVGLWISFEAGIASAKREKRKADIFATRMTCHDEAPNPPCNR